MLGFQKVIATASMSKICRICLEEGVLSSIFAKDYNIALSDMIDYCSNITISKNDGLPEQMCSNCIYKLGIAYQFKQTSQRSDMRLRQYLGLPRKSKFTDASVMTDFNVSKSWETRHQPIIAKCKCKLKSQKRYTNYKKKTESEKLKRGPKPKPKKIHSCVQCNKEFRCEAQLEMHVRTHTGDKPFVCMYCPRSFTQKHNLTIHLRLHTGEKPFQCEVCSKRFSAQGNLNAHLKIHTGQKDHVCAVCNKSFITTSELSRHMNKHTKVQKFKCDVCGAPYTHKRDLKLHKMKNHQLLASDQKTLNETFNNSNNIDIIGLDEVNTSINKIGTHFAIQPSDNKMKVDPHFMHHSDNKHPIKEDTHFMHHSDNKHPSKVVTHFMHHSDNKHPIKDDTHFMHHSDDNKHTSKMDIHFMHLSDDNKHPSKSDNHFINQSDDGSKHQSRVSDNFVPQPDENKHQGKVNVHFLHQTDDDNKHNYVHKPENHLLYNQKLKGFHQYNERTLIESHNCTICGEVFNCVVALAQHCLNHHKGYTPLQTSKTYI